jgi:hypothetical protein
MAVLFERGLDILLMHLAQIPGSGDATGRTGVALPAPHLNAVYCMVQIVLLPDLNEGLADTQVTSRRSTM